jgi:hypothetical protein
MRLFDHHESLRKIAATGFMASLVSYAAFWLADAVRPGFAARTVSVHVFLLACLAFGALWIHVGAESRPHPMLATLLLIPLSLVSAVLLWNLGAGFGDARILATLFAAATPLALYRLLKP